MKKNTPVGWAVCLSVWLGWLAGQRAWSSPIYIDYGER